MVQPDRAPAGFRGTLPEENRGGALGVPDVMPVSDPDQIANPGRFVPPLLQWYREHARSLPWRAQGTPDPYRVWVSEIMLQQTRVETVIPYYQRWMERFPSV